MKKVIPCCSVCENRYNEQERCPLLLECGHSYCKDCLFKLFSSSADTSLPCPRCRHVSLVGNSVYSLKKNFAVLSLIQDDDEDEDEDDDDDEGREQVDVVVVDHHRCQEEGLIEVGSHQDLKLVSQIGQGRRSGVEMWSGVVSGRNCKHNVAVKKVVIGEDMDLVWVQNQLETLRRASMWCRNVCAFHGLIKNQGCLNLLMDKCSASVLTEMQRNGGRLTLEQILRFVCFLLLFLLLYVYFDYDLIHETEHNLAFTLGKISFLSYSLAAVQVTSRIDVLLMV